MASNPGIGIIIALVIFGFGFYMFSRQTISIGPCHGYMEVGEVDQKINSEQEAKQTALDYYASIGYNFEIENMEAKEISKGWSIRPDISKFGVDKLCHRGQSPPECIGQELKFEKKLFGKTKILMEYQIPC